jgi:DNA-nicking Smr family endonuclease
MTVYDMKQKKQQRRKLTRQGVRQLDTLNTSQLFDIEPNAKEIFKTFLSIDDFAGAKKPQDELVKKSRTKKKLVSKNVDLHGYSFDEAARIVDSIFSQQIEDPMRLKIITGKGLHSGETGPVLVRKIYEHIQETYRSKIIAIDQPPIETQVNGLPSKGHFYVTLRR